MSLNYSFVDIRYYFEKHKKYLFWLFCFFVIGLIFGVIIAITSDSYLSILSSTDKIFYDYVKGNVSLSKQVTSLIIKNLLFELIIFLLCLDFYPSLICYLFVSYQSATLMLSAVAIITEFGLSGLMIVLFLQLPINLILFASNMLFSSLCLRRSFYSKRYKRFSFGFKDREFFIPVLILIVFIICFSFIINLILFLILRSRIFIIF